MDGENNGKAYYKKKNDLGGPSLFWETPISAGSSGEFELLLHHHLQFPATVRFPPPVREDQHWYLCNDYFQSMKKRKVNNLHKMQYEVSTEKFIPYSHPVFEE